jgi:transcriptional regulator with XRE-family HTH domain
VVERNEGGFGDWLREQLQVRGWTQSEFAARAGVRSQRISYWLRGVHPSSRHVPAIARALGLSAEAVYRALAGNAMTERAFHSPRSVADILTDAMVSAPVAVPVVRPADARLGADAPILDFLYLPTSYRSDPPRRLFALAVADAGMESDIRTGDTVVVDAARTPAAGDVGLLWASGAVRVARYAEIGGRRVWRADASGETVTGDPLGVVVLIQRTLGGDR